MKRVLLAAGMLMAVVYLKLCVPGFSENTVPLMKEWLEMEQVSLCLPEEAMDWLLLP